jgi:hypothetical protein
LAAASQPFTDEAFSPSARQRPGAACMAAGCLPREASSMAAPCGRGTPFEEAAALRDGGVHTRLDGSTSSERRWRYPDHVASEPCKWFWINFSTIFLLIAVVGVSEESHRRHP